MKCPTCNQSINNWLISKRKHRRPPRMFVICPHCKDELQAVPNINGEIDHVFKTGTPRNPELKGRYIRLTDKDYKDIQEKKRLGIYT